MDHYTDVFEVQRRERDRYNIRVETVEPRLLTIDDCKPLVLNDVDKVRSLLTKYVETEVQKEHIKLFEHYLYAPNTYWVEVADVGLVYFTAIEPRFTACLQMIFWDKRLGADRRKIVKELVRRVFTDFALTRMQAQTPITNGHLQIALRKIGMTQEGTLRNAWRDPDGVDHDLIVFGLLQSEVNTWPQLMTSSEHHT